MHWSKDPQMKEHVIKILKEKGSGENNSMYGKHHTKETKEKLSKLQTGISVPTRGREKGEPLEKEHIDKIKQTLQLHGKEFLSNRAKKSHTPESDQKRRDSMAQHNNKVLEIAEKYRKEGYEVITERDLRPDLIIRKGNIIKAVEVQRSGKKQHNYGNQKVFNEVVWEAF